MLFGFKNKGAIYQKFMCSKVLEGCISKLIEGYIKDIFIKSTSICSVTTNLQLAFDPLHKFNMQFNPLKGIFF